MIFIVELLYCLIVGGIAYKVHGSPSPKSYGGKGENRKMWGKQVFLLLRKNDRQHRHFPFGFFIKRR
jgi:hypothetical protein